MTTPSTLAQLTTERLIRDDLPLAVYREVAAHLQQVPQVQVQLEPRLLGDFNYFHSQIGAMIISYPQNLSPGGRQRIEAILDFYHQRYGPWQREQNTLDMDEKS
ncbi:hypothetical protein NIES970_19610 [[Synechococcus] sp. NIES-970]|nr:hypothetical protein NIES970_19610 [[Synechococcus] sp. NIES-970]